MARSDRDERVASLSQAKRELLDRWVEEAGLPKGARAEPTTDTERALVAIWQDLLRKPDIGVEDNFFVLGGDSITSLQIASRAAQVGLRITSRQVLEAETIRGLAELATPRDRTVEQEVADATGTVPLTPIQRWFFEQGFPQSHYWNQMIVVELRRQVDDLRLKQALAHIVRHHDVLRSHFVLRGEEWTQEFLADAPEPAFRLIDGSGVDPSDYSRHAADVATELQEEIDLSTGPLAAAALIRRSVDERDGLLLLIHHLVVDGVSLRVLIEDLERAYEQLTAGEPVRLPETSMSFRAWSLRLQQYAVSDRVSRQLPYWRGVPRASASEIPVDRDGANTAGTSARAAAELEPEVADLLLHSVTGTQVHHVLLASMLLAWARRTGRREIQLDLEGHGREPIDSTVEVSRTVGWFTSIFPIVLEVPDSMAPGDVLAAVQQRTSAVPDAGIGYGLLRYLHPSTGSRLAELPQSRMSFNYLGRFEPPRSSGTFGAPVQVPSLLQSSKAPRPYYIEMVATAIENRLLLEWVYSSDQYGHAKIAGLLAEQVDSLRELAAYLQSAGRPNTSSLGPSVGGLSRAQLTTIEQQLRARRRP